MRLLIVALAALLSIAPVLASEEEGPAFESPMLAAGEIFEWTVPADHAGETIAYHCHPHPWMVAEIHVTAGDGGAVHDIAIVEQDPADVNTWGYEPASLEVHPGDTIRWTNAGALEHTAIAEAADHGHEEADTPALGVLLVGITLAVVAIVRRR